VRMLVQFSDRTSSGVTPYPIGCADPPSARVAEAPIRRGHCIFSIAAGIYRRLNRLCGY
jgi:hypothetical protein